MTNKIKKRLVAVAVMAIVLCMGMLCMTANAYDEPTRDTNGYYEIDTASKLYWFAERVNGGSTVIHARLTADIVLNENVIVDGALNSDTSGLTTWTPIGTQMKQFAGTFDGNGHTISGLYINNEEMYVGLVGYTNVATIKNVGIIDSYINGGYYVGGVCGYSSGGTIQNCYNKGIVKASVSYVGGVCGYDANCSIIDCYNEGTVSGKNYVGGVCGASTGIVTKSYNKGVITGESYVGGVCGSSNTTTYCYNTGAVTGSSDNVGGVCGKSAAGEITNCYNQGAVTGTGEKWYSIGGICGYNQGGTVTNCYNSAEVTGVKGYYDYVGMLVGKNTGTITNCYYIADSETDSLDGTLYKTADQFASGEVAYLLNGDQQAIEFGQTIRTDSYPTLGGATVYYGYETCIANEQIYSNVEISSTLPHIIDNYVCTVCGEKITAIVTSFEGTAPVIADDAAVTSADSAETATYSDIKKNADTVKTLYVKVVNPTENVTPVVVINDNEQASVWTANVTDNEAIYIAQFIGNASEFETDGEFENVKITYSGADDAVIVWE